jgi:ABC-type multidrug transport system fused ATPase/permease subunit
MSLSMTKRVCQGIWLWQFQVGHLDAPMVMYLNFLTEEVINTFWTYAGVLERMYEGVEPARVLVNLMEETPAIRSAPGAAPVQVPDVVSIELRKVSFGYDKDSKVLEDLSLTVEPGSVIGIVGRSGIGKTTLQHLLSRTYDVQSGSVSIAGVDVREWPLEQLRGLFASVTQHGGVFFSGTTLLDALRFACPDASYAQIADAARCAAIHDDIVRMPDGYGTVLAAGGLNFSKGQQQRIALAQALLSLRDDRKILILDEFTSALDSQTEQQILHNLRLRLRGKTVIIIAHRLATLSRLADRIVVIEDGAIAEEGSHTELMSRGNRYAHLVQLQNVA